MSRSARQWLLLLSLIILGVVVGLLASGPLDWGKLDDARDLVSGESAKKPLRVLFVGNSYTFVNDLPLLVRRLASAAHEELRFEAVSECPPGSSLKQHWSSGRDAALLRDGHFDWVVLQEQSVVPSFAPAQLETDMYPFVTRLHDAATEAGTKTLLFMTWGHEKGDLANLRRDTYDAMQTRVVAGYETIAGRLHVSIAPVGIAWRRAVQANAGAPLWAADGIHPSPAGSYLAACVFYDALYGHTPVGDSFTGGLDGADARALQEISADTMAQYRQP